MPSADIRNTLNELNLTETVKRAAESTLANMIATEFSAGLQIEKPQQLLRFAFLFERLGIEAYQEFRNGAQIVAGATDDGQSDLRKAYLEGFKNAFYCWRSISYFNGSSSSVSQDALDLVSLEYSHSMAAPGLLLAFHLAVCGLCSGSNAEVRLELRRFSFEASNPDSWHQRVHDAILEAVVHLIRKGDGWEDIRHVRSLIESLRTLQNDFESNYLDTLGDRHNQVKGAIGLVGFYHMAQLLSLTAQYVLSGTPSKTALDARVSQHRSRAITAFETVNDQINKHLVDLVVISSTELAQNSIWTHAATVASPLVRQFMQSLANEGSTNPVIELWPAQQEALRQNVLSTYHRAILIQMPTSSGKTLLAKFAIVQSKALDPHSTIAYVVPSRALVNQITRDLRSDFRGLEPSLHVEQSVPAFQLDPTEDQLLSQAPDVLVTTPEKLDLLIRKNHQSIRNLSYVVVDEAHHVSDGGRGARLELLLSTIKRDFDHVRFMLLSPFLPNDRELLFWLGENEALPPIAINWRPSNRVIGTTSYQGRGRHRRFVFETIPAADNSDISEELRIPIAPADTSEGPNSKEYLSRITAKALGNRGAVLILCKGRGTATARASQLKSDVPRQPSTPEKEAVCHYIEAEIGSRVPLVDSIEHGIAYHHAGLSHEARSLIEWLVRLGQVRFVCGTTTLAEGVNFPISTVIVETLRKGPIDLSYNDFWNIAGRAGRTLMDTVGLIAFPSRNSSDRNRFAEFLQGEAQEVVSQLSNLISRADILAGRFDLGLIYRNPGLSELLQYLAHAMKVANRSDLAQEVEDIMRSSLVYHQLRREGQPLADRLVEVCRLYLTDLANRREVRGILGLADQTGFATPSVLAVLGRKRENPGLSSVGDWSPDVVFGNDIRYMTERISAVGELPEIRLGQGQSGPFNPAYVASILRDWARGESLYSLTEEYYVGDKQEIGEQISDFSTYLFSQLISRASWGLGALETICLDGISDEDWRTVGYIPSMVFYGVNMKEAVWLRMVGVPRPVANGLANIWIESRTNEPQSYEDLRTWISGLSDDQWVRALPTGSSLTGADCKLLWSQLSGSF